MKWDVTKLTPSQKRIADFIEKSGEHILYFSETELAQKLNVSNATISRFWKQIGYENFKLFKTAIKENEQMSPEKKIEKFLTANPASAASHSRTFTNNGAESVC